MPRIHTIGDPHLGKVFRNGVPLHRRGQREASVWRDFEKALDVDCDISVTMGDLLDKRVVAPEVVLRAATLYRQAALNYPETEFVVLRGNHDASRDADQRSSFDLFSAIVADIKNLTVVAEDVVTMGSDYLFVPWHPFRTAAEMVAMPRGDFKAVMGHWDIRDFGGENTNLIPIELLKEMTDTVYSGHDHTPQELVMKG